MVFRKKRTGSVKFRNARKNYVGTETDYPEEIDPMKDLITVTATHHLLGVTHTFIFRKGKRCDVFKIWVDGELMPEQRGWSRGLVWLREAFPRIGSRKNS